MAKNFLFLPLLSIVSPSPLMPSVDISATDVAIVEKVLVVEDRRVLGQISEEESGANSSLDSFSAISEMINLT